MDDHTTIGPLPQELWEQIYDHLVHHAGKLFLEFHPKFALFILLPVHPGSFPDTKLVGTYEEMASLNLSLLRNVCVQGCVFRIMHPGGEGCTSILQHEWVQRVLVWITPSLTHLEWAAGPIGDHFEWEAWGDLGRLGVLPKVIYLKVHTHFQHERYSGVLSEEYRQWLDQFALQEFLCAAVVTSEQFPALEAIYDLSGVWGEFSPFSFDVACPVLRLNNFENDPFLLAAHLRANTMLGTSNDCLAVRPVNYHDLSILARKDGAAAVEGNPGIQTMWESANREGGRGEYAGLWDTVGEVNRTWASFKLKLALVCKRFRWHFRK